MQMFEKMCSTEKPLYLNFDEALKTSRDPKVIKKKIIIASTYCEDLAKLFSYVNFQVFAITHYDSLNLKKYCKKIFVVKDYNLKTLKKIFLKIDPYQNSFSSGFRICRKSKKLRRFLVTEKIMVMILK